MVKYLRTLFFIGLILLTAKSYGQVSAYTFTAFNRNYVELTGGTIAVLTENTSSTYPGDDAYSNNLPIGFTFNYDGVDYTTISVTTNGWACFGQSLISSDFTNEISSRGTRPLIA